MVSSSIGYYHLVQLSNQPQWYLPILFWETLGPSWPTSCQRVTKLWNCNFLLKNLQPLEGASNRLLMHGTSIKAVFLFSFYFFHYLAKYCFLLPFMNPKHWLCPISHAPFSQLTVSSPHLTHSTLNVAPSTFKACVFCYLPSTLKILSSCSHVWHVDWPRQFCHTDYHLAFSEQILRFVHINLD